MDRIQLDVKKRIGGQDSLEGAFVETAFTNDEVFSAISEEALRGGLVVECAFLAESAL